MKVIIAGDLEFNNFDMLENAIAQSGFEITEVVSGGARGADELGELWAKANEVPVKIFKANWNDIKAPGAIVKARRNPWTKKMEKYNAGAGFARNEEMAKYADALIAIQPKGPTPGTQNMIKLAKQNNLKVHVYEKQDDEYEYKF